MSRYTTQIRMLVDNNFKFNLYEYPIFDEDYRDILNDYILEYYMMYEIEFETAELFNHYLGVTMKSIMPKYNVLYQQQQKMLSHLSVEVVETFMATNTQDKINSMLNKVLANSNSNIGSKSDSNTNTISNATGENKYLDTAMGNIKNLDDGYLTSASKDKSDASDTTITKGNSDTSSKSDSESEQNTKTEDKVEGSNEYIRKTMDPEKALNIIKLIKENFINIDYEIVLELDKLFFKML